MPEGRVISFRLDERHHARLAERATVLSQSVGEVARQFVLDGVLGVSATAHLEVQIRELDARLHQANYAIQALRRDFRVAVRAILATAGNVPDADLDDWTQSNLSNPDDLDLKSHP